MPPRPPIIADARFVMSTTTVDGLPAPAFAELALAGRSNVGKSSLLNMLLERKKLVRTSATPGATRGLNVFRVEMREPDGVADFVDLPGYGFAKRSHAERRSWGPLVEGFLERRVALRGVVVIVDVRRGVGAEERELFEFLDHVNRTPVLVVTKIDKLPMSQRKTAVAAVGRAASRRAFGVSAETGEGREALWWELLRVLDIRST